MFLTREQARDVDRRAMEEYGLIGLVLMENAGRGCAELIDCGPVVVCCGKGNNGGDGYVIARHLDNRGVGVRILSVCPIDQLRGDALVNARICERAGLSISVLGSPTGWEGAVEELRTAVWIVDALLGTGFQGELREPYISAIQAINRAGRNVLAVDVPSGLDVDTGRATGECVRATLTATFVAEKIGFREPSARSVLGDMRVIDIGVPLRLLTRHQPSGS